jgi:hypothetical protein
MSRHRPKGDGSVGRGRPPAHSRFKPGQSGNPRGRPKRSKNMATLLEDELNQIVPITENGKRRKVRKRELIVMQAVNAAAKGDLRALIALWKLAPEANTPVASAPETVLGGEEDDQILRDLLQRMKDETNEPR